MKSRSSNSVLSVFNLRPRRIGGTEIYARELTYQLAAFGWRSILCFISPPPSRVADFMAPSGPTIEVVPGIHDSGWSTVQKLWTLIQKYRPRIVHLHYTPLLSPAPWLGWMLSVERTFYTEQSSRPENSQPCAAARWKQIIARRLSPWDGIFCGSQYGQRCLRARGYLRASKIHTVYNATMLAENHNSVAAGAAFRHRYGIPRDALLIVQVGQLAEYKGVRDLIGALAIVRKEIDSIHLALVGDGPLLAQIAHLAEELGLDECVRLTGMIDCPISDGVYAAADICCQVSRWEELFGFTIAEAMACRRPVVGTAVGGIPEVITDGITGYLAPRRDVNRIADRIITLAKDADMRTEMGLAGRKKAMDKFDVQKNVAQLIDLYEIVS